MPSYVPTSPLHGESLKFLAFGWAVSLMPTERNFLGWIFVLYPETPRKVEFRARVRVIAEIASSRHEQNLREEV
jgi:hypothetical protein